MRRCRSIVDWAPTPHRAAIPPCPSGCGGTGPFAALVLLDVARGYAVGAPPCAWPRGARNAVRSTSSTPFWSEYRNVIGEDSRKIRREGDSVWVWAGGAESGPGAEWYDFTGAPIPAGELQYGLGRDAIPSIDEPVFVEPDDPRLMEIPDSPYRKCERPTTPDEIMVIGHVVDGVARAYPTALLDHHEIVNDRIRDEPFTVAWCPLADLAAVHGREHGGEVHEWGVSGYVYRNVFLVYDRATGSLWYPFDEEGWTAISGPRQGELVEFYGEVEPIPLGEWRERHPDTEVLLAGEERME